MSSFVHLCCHSVYSLLESCLSISQLIQAARKNNMPAVALTDTNGLFAAVNFYKDAKKAGIKPLLGLTLSVKIYEIPRPLIVIAQNNQGWENLKRLSSQSFFHEDGLSPHVTLDFLLRHHEGLFLITGGLDTEIHHLLSNNRDKSAEDLLVRLYDVFGKNLYLEITDHGISEEQNNRPKLLDLSRKLNLPLVATNRIYYALPEHAEYHDTMRCIAERKTKNDLDRAPQGFGEFYFRSAEEMSSLFADIPEAVENTLKIAEACQVDLRFPGPLLPEFQVPQNFDLEQQEQAREKIKGLVSVLETRFTDEALAKLSKDTKNKDPHEVAENVRSFFFQRLDNLVTQYFVYLSHMGLTKRYTTVTRELQDRLDYELTVIILMDFVGYFLIVADFINWAKDHDIPVGPGRGSGAGSLVAYSLRITDIDPIRYKLLFERFLNPERVSMPDFDVDFCFERRQEVIDYVTRKYGQDNVAQIISFGTLQPKAVVKDVGRVLGLSFNERNQITKFIDNRLPDPDNPKEIASLKKMVQIVPELKQYYEKGGIYKELFDTAAFLEGLPRHASTHAAGLVIGKTQIIDYVPLYRDPKTNTTLTQYSMKYLEDCGLVKMDFLGLKTLTLIKNTLHLLRKRGIQLSEEEIPFDDATTYKMLGEAKSSMIFQFESAGMRKVLKKAKPQSLEDLTALNALYRPGPMDNIPTFIERKMSGRIEYPHPSLQPILKETYGIIVYQEQVMQAAQILAGYSLGAADLLRRAMGKKEIEVMDKQRPMFIEGFKKQHGVSSEKASEVFDLLKKFASYGFNKSHAAAYAFLAYKTAYLKANYPAEFLAANLTNEIDKPEKLAEYIAEARKMNIDIVPPNVNHSEKYFSVKDGKIIYGLLAIKNLGDGPVDEILRARTMGGPFKDLEDLLLRTNSRLLAEKQIATLIDAGALDGLGHNRATLKHFLPQVLIRVNKIKEEIESKQTTLFGEPGSDLPPVPWTELPEIDTKTKLDLEEKLLGFYFSGHPLDDYRERWEQYSNLNLGKVKHAKPKTTYQILGELSNIRIFNTKSGERMAVGVLKDFLGSIDLRVFPRVYEAIRENFIEGKVVGLRGRVDFYDDQAQFTVDELEVQEPLANSQELTETHMALCIEIKPKDYLKSEIASIYDFFQNHRGKTPLYLRILPMATSHKPWFFKTSLFVTLDPKFKDKLKDQSWFHGFWKFNPTLH